MKLAEASLAEPNLKDAVVNVLTEYRNDRWIGRAVRRLLCEEQLQQENESVHIIREMLSSLNVAGNDDDVRDCN